MSARCASEKAVGVRNPATEACERVADLFIT
jgi:hypothetical protein